MASPAAHLARTTAHGLPLVRGAVGRGLGRVFGPPPFDVTGAADAGDPGLFGPGSASWRVIAEPAAIVGGLRSLLVQLTHPLAMAGVADHSGFRDDPLGRLRRTSGYVTTLTFGSAREALAVTREVRRVHRTVQGTAPDGRPYRAVDPHLLAWVSLAMTSSMLVTDAAYGLDPVDVAIADAFVAEQSRGAALLDPRVDLAALETDPDAVAAFRRGALPLPMIEEGTLPTTVAELEGALTRFRSELAVGEQGRRALRFLLWPDVPPAVRGAYLPLLAAALATLPPDLRRLLGVPAWRAPAAAVRIQARAGLALLRVATGPSPNVAAATRRAAGTGTETDAHASG